MKTKILSIGIIKNGNTILLRKKPDGSAPYKETWYLFGGEVDEDVYVGIVRDIMGKEVDSEQAERIYNNVIEMGELLGKERGGSYTALLPE